MVVICAVPISVLYTAFLLNTAVYHLAVQMISTLPIKHSLISFMHVFVKVWLIMHRHLSSNK